MQEDEQWVEMLNPKSFYYPECKIVLDSKLTDDNKFSSDKVAEIIAILDKGGNRGKDLFLL